MNTPNRGRQDHLKKIFAVRLKASRKIRGWTQCQLGERSGISPAHIAQFECQARLPALVNLVVLAEALHVPLDYLIARDKYLAGRDAYFGH